MEPIRVLGRPSSLALLLAFALVLTGELAGQQHRVVELWVPKQPIASTLDGLLTTGDNYTLGPLPNAGSSVSFYMKTYRGWNGTTVDEELQMFYNISSTAYDKVTIELDFDHNDLVPSGIRRRVEITKNPSTSMPCANCMTLFNVTTNTAMSVSNQPRNNPGPPWTLEFHLSASDLGLNTLPALIGLYTEVTGGALITIYPTALTGEPATSVLNRNTWAHVRTRNPADFAMMLDASGSMLQTDGTPETRWQRATRATDVMAAALSLFNDASFVDQIAAAQYSWGCGNGDLTGPLPVGNTWKTIITGAPTKLTQGSSPPMPGNCTPIQRGLDFAINSEGGTAAGPANLGRDRIVVLLSDGLHNKPSATFDLNAPEFAGKHDLVQVITVAMLPDGTGGTMLMDQITDAFRGPPYKARYNNVIQFADLLQVYLEPLEDLHAVNFVSRDADLKFRPGQAAKLVFLAAWNTAAQASALTVVNDAAPTGPIIPFFDQTTGYAAAVATAPPATGGWTVTAAGSAPDAVYLIVDMQVYAQFLVEQRQYSAGEPVLLTVDLRDRGSPILGADVTFSMDRPGMGLGDFLSTIQSNCAFAEPKVPPPPPRPDSLRLGVGLARAGRAASVTGTGGDPLPGRYQLAADDFKRCGPNLLGRLQDAGIRLHDDGIAPDKKKDDGVYAYAFTPPEEGSYNLTFRVSGNTTDGGPFRRSYRLSEFARITPTAKATSQIVQNGGIVNGRQVTHVLLLFRDSLGNFVGPGLADLFKITVVGAHVPDSLSDLGNGYYRISLDYAPGGPEPVVSVRIPGSTYEQRIDLSPGHDHRFGPSLHGGISLPSGSFKTSYDQGFGITADAEYWFNRRLALQGLFGYHRFGGKGTNPDLEITHASGGLEARITTGSPSLVIEGGGGTYHFKPGSSYSGTHAGASVEFDVSPRVSLGANGRLHTVFTTGSHTSFYSVQAGGWIKL